jgi:hypothetical protein
MRLPLTVLAMTFALVVAALQKSDSNDSHTSVQSAHDEYERHKQTAIRVNDLAGAFTRMPMPIFSYRRLQVFLQRNCRPFGLMAAPFIALHMLSTRPTARKDLSPSNA